MKTKYLLLGICILSLTSGSIHAKQSENTQVFRVAESAGSLDVRWNLAVRQSQSIEGDFWIGYEFRSMNTNCSFHRISDEPSLSQLLNPSGSDEQGKRIGQLFLLGNGKSHPYDAREIEISAMNDGIDLKGNPLIWLGKADAQSSFELCRKAFGKTESPNLREDLVGAIAMHPHSEESTAFFKEVIASDPSNEVREEAVFWIAFHDPTALNFLRDLARKDRSQEVRKKAVFAITQIRTPEAVDALIELTRSSDSEVAEQAVFWLGQIASEKAVKLLKDIVWDDTETDIQTKAVFALSQQGSVDELIEIANTHPNPEVRKKAIFWLGQSKDKKAVEAIIRIIRENG